MNGSCNICNKHHAQLRKHFINCDSSECIEILKWCSVCINCYDKIEDGCIIVEGWIMTHKGLQLVWHQDTSTYYSSSSESDV
jgi:hypothetical protein